MRMKTIKLWAYKWICRRMAKRIVVHVKRIRQMESYVKRRKILQKKDLETYAKYVKLLLKEK